MNKMDVSKKNLDIPNRWEKQKVKILFDIKKELNFQDNPNILSLARDGIKVRDITTGEGQIAASYEKYNDVKSGDLLLNPMDLVSGANCNVSQIKGIISPAYINLKPKLKANPYFFDYYFKTQYWNKSFFAHGKGVSYENRWTLNNETILNYYIPVPTFEEQNKIVKFLDKKIKKIDDEISLLKKTNTKLDEKFNIYLEKKIKSISSKTVPLKIKTKIITSNVDKKIYENEKIYEVCNYTDVYYNKYISNKIKYKKASVSKQQLENYLLSNGDVIITKDSEDNKDIGIPSIYKLKEKKIVCGYHLSIIKNTDEINSEFLYYYLLTKSVKNYFEKTTNGITRYGLKLSTIKNLKLPNISVEHQKLISKEIKNKDQIIKKIRDNNNQKLKLLEEYKKVLIHDAVTGKIDIGDEYGK